MLSELNWLAIIVSTVFSMVLGFIWYGPLFDTAWMKLVGLKKEDVDAKDSMKGMVISSVNAPVSSCISRIVSM